MASGVSKADMPDKVVSDANDHSMEDSDSDENEEDEDQEEEEDNVNNGEYFLKWPGNLLTHRVMRI